MHFWLIRVIDQLRIGIMSVGGMGRLSVSPPTFFALSAVSLLCSLCSLCFFSLTASQENRVATACACILVYLAYNHDLYSLSAFKIKRPEIQNTIMTSYSKPGVIHPDCQLFLTALLSRSVTLLAASYRSSMSLSPNLSLFSSLPVDICHG